MTGFVLPLDDRSADLATVGGKGASLARLTGAGLPVPPGFHVSTAAYNRFVEENALRDRILAALDDGAESASREISELFLRVDLPSDLAELIRTAYARLGDIPVAVRSSATAEDLPEASFAGQQDTYLDVCGDKAVLDAVKRCWASLWTARAIDYRARHGIEPAEVSLAVVVQQMVPADCAGVLFTADPVTGDRERIVINAVRGLGEALVSGAANPQSLVADRSSREITGRTGEQVIDDALAAELFAIGLRIEELYGMPMDIEWAVRDRHVFVVQARPITVQTYEQWNDSLRGRYLWTNANLGEAVPDVMTPLTWSLVKMFMTDAMATSSLPQYPGYGNVGGRFYMNLSMSYTLARAFGMGKRFMSSIEQVFGRLPAGVEIPPLPVSRWQIIRALLPVVRRTLKRVKANAKAIPEFVESSPSRSEQLRSRIADIGDPAALAAFWRKEIEPYFHQSCFMLEAAGRQDGAALITVRTTLTKLVGEADMNAMTSSIGETGGPLESLGPLLGLAQLARNEIDRETYARRYGHRSASEFEISTPRPAEDPAWLDKQLAGLAAAKEQPADLLERQEAASKQAWQHFGQRYPRKLRTVRRQVDRWSKAAKDRELTRSEVIRAFWVLRTFALRAGALSGLGDDVFFLDIREVLDVLDAGSDTKTTALVEVRRATYDRYRALPPYPTVVLGHFDPLRWATDPNRRSDLYDEHATGGEASDAVRGFAGASGVVEGFVRVIASVDDADQLEPGEILVTTVTNIGWTPVFPRAAAVVTDVGAPLSHAAIVARELGIPAVVGTGNATMRLHTGDRVRVDGEKGTVERADGSDRGVRR